MTTSGALVVAVPVPAALWFLYFRFKDRLKPEPLWLLARTFAFGMASAILASLVYVALDWLSVPVSEQGLAARGTVALATAAMVGLVEEGSKFLPVLAFVYRRREFDEEFDGFVYACVAALGFAAVENWFLLGRMTDHSLFLIRALVSPLTHALISAPWGMGLAVAKLAGRRWAIPVGLLVAAACHGMFDLCLYRPPPMRFGSAFIVLALWSWLLWKADHQRVEGSTGVAR